MSMTHRILTSCDAPGCVGLSTQDWPVEPRFRLAEACLPDGWFEFHGKTFCPRHNVTVTISVDGKNV